jgi:hypothetical protein
VILRSVAHTHAAPSNPIAIPIVDIAADPIAVAIISRRRGCIGCAGCKTEAQNAQADGRCSACTASAAPVDHATAPATPATKGPAAATKGPAATTAHATTAALNLLHETVIGKGTSRSAIEVDIES